MVFLKIKMKYQILGDNKLTLMFLNYTEKHLSKEYL